MYVSFPRDEKLDTALNNLATTLESAQNQIVFSPACDAGVRNDERFFIALHALKINIEETLKLADFTER